MKRFFTLISNSMHSFVKNEKGAQVVEYALIIAVISIALVIALRTLTTDAGADFTNFIGRVKTCLTETTCA